MLGSHAHDQSDKATWRVASDLGLIGRTDEMAMLSALLEQAPERGGTAVLRGEAGVGKTALLRKAITSADGFSVVRAAGIESEMELPFAGLHQLCLPLLDRLDHLPDPQRDALETAFGLSAGPVPDRFLVALAALGLLSDAASRRPLLCVVDDAQWLDRESAQALTFVGRRVKTERIVLLFAIREPDRKFAGLRELPIVGLRADDARELLSSGMPGPLDPEVRERIIAETRGNPLALLELPRGLKPEQLAGGFGLLEASSLTDRIEASFAQRLQLLPEPTRLFLLIAAAESVGDAALVRLAGQRLGLTDDVLEPARQARLLEVSDRVRFRHPLVRSAVYRKASAEDRRRVHATIADVTDPAADPDRRAWHRAQATVDFDESVATELERSAGRARRRAGWAAAARFLERATVLTPDLSRRTDRAMTAAHAMHLAGAPSAALGLLSVAESGPMDAVRRARIDLLRGRIAHSQNRGSDAAVLLLKAAEQLTPIDPRLARETYLDAVSAAQLAGRLAPRRGSSVSVAEAAFAAPAGSVPPRASDLLLDGLATRVRSGSSSAAPLLKRALRAWRGGTSTEDEFRWMWLAGHAAVELWDYEAFDMVVNRHFELAADSGALGVLSLALSVRVAVCAFTGELDAAAQLVDDVHAAVQSSDIHVPAYARLLLAAWRGREHEATKLADSLSTEVGVQGAGLGLTIADLARAVLYNGLGRYDDALAAAERASEQPSELAYYQWGLIEVVSAAAHAGRPDRAAAAFSRLTESTRASGGDWALGIKAHSHALLSERESAEQHYREAIERLGRTPLRVALARAQLDFGKWLRRGGRRLEAREQLRASAAALVELGIGGFAERADQELVASGETSRHWTAQARTELSEQEARVARLASDGLSNPEIGASLFISPRTVEYHLHKVFTKLEISSRSQLRRALPRDQEDLTASE